MAQDDKAAGTTYKVVVNEAEQYSIWPADRENARGWSETGATGTLAECEAYVENMKAGRKPRGAKEK